MLADIPSALPALSRAQKVQKRAAQVGFDWHHIDAVVMKVEEELQEFVDAQQQSGARQEEEIGDLLFTCVNLARHAGVDAETALRRSTRKFESRFAQMELQLAEAGEPLEKASAESLNAHWERVKSGE